MYDRYMSSTEQYTALCETCRGKDGKTGIIIGTADSWPGMRAQLSIWTDHANQRHHNVTIYGERGEPILRLPQDIPPGGIVNIGNLVVNIYMMNRSRAH